MNTFSTEILFHNDINKPLITLKGKEKSVKLMGGSFKYNA